MTPALGAVWFGNYVTMELTMVSWKTLIAVFGCIAFVSSSANGDLIVRWAGAVDSHSGFVSGSDNALGIPKTDETIVGSNSPVLSGEITFSSFGNVSTSFTRSQLATALGISQSELAAYDFLAMDHNSGSVTFFETSVWTFDDGIGSLVVNHDVNSPPTNVLMTQFDRTTYNTVFGANVLFGNSIGVLLFDLGTLDVSSSVFSVNVSSVGGTSHTPDLTGLGVITAVPEPSSALATGVFLVVGFCVKGARRLKRAAVCSRIQGWHLSRTQREF